MCQWGAGGAARSPIHIYHKRLTPLHPVSIKTVFRAVLLAFVNESFKYTNSSLMPIVQLCASPLWDMEYFLKSDATNSHHNTDNNNNK